MNRFNFLLKLFGSHSRSVRHKLRRDLVILILLTSGSMLAVTAVMTTEIMESLAHAQIKQSTEQVSEQFSRFFEPIKRGLLIARTWGLADKPNLQNVSNLNLRFIPTLEQMPQVSALIIANSNAAEYFLLKDGAHWLTRSTGLGDVGQTAVWRRWSTDLALLKQWSKASDYDPRSRPWFEGAVTDVRETGKVFWTKPYTFYTRKTLGVTASASWKAADIDFVVAFDVLLSEIVQSITRLRPSEQGRAFLLNDEGAVYTPTESNDTSAFQHGVFLSLHDDPATKAAFEAARIWREHHKPSEQPLELEVDGGEWWARIRPLNPDSQGLWFGIAVPESDFLGEVKGKWEVIAIVGTAVLLTGAALAYLLVSRYSRQLKDLPKLGIDDSESESEIKSLIESGESSTLEFKSTMRMNLKTGKTGKEIEIAWLKTVVGFMNTEGGILLIGVDDAGEILGIEADGFENLDRCRLHFKNVFNQHIGLEFSKFVNFDIQSVSGKEIIVIECERSTSPVFLLNKSEEAFFIRSGPSSVKLPISKALKYLKNRA